MITRLQRWGNKAGIAACASPLHTWLRKGDYKTRLMCFRDMCLDPSKALPSSETCTHAELVSECHSLSIEFLVDFAKGKIGADEVDKHGNPKTTRSKPYGVHGAKKSHFCNLSSTWFGVTMAALYPFLAEDKDKWTLRIKGKLGNFSHPASGLWPVKIVKRHIHFQKTMKEHLETMLETYQRYGGKFDEESADEDNEEEEEVVQASESDCDDVF